MSIAFKSLKQSFQVEKSSQPSNFQIDGYCWRPKILSERIRSPTINNGIRNAYCPELLINTGWKVVPARSELTSS